MFGPITNADTTSCLLRTTGETSRRSPQDRYPVHIRENRKGKINVTVTENAAFTMILRDTVLHCVNYQPLKHVGLQLGVGMGDVLASLEPATIGQLTSGDNPYQSLSQDGMALAIRAEAYAVQPSVSPPNPSGNPRLNPCKPGGFTETSAETAQRSFAMPPTPEEVGLLAQRIVKSSFLR